MLKRKNTTIFSFVFETRMNYISKAVVPPSENGGGELNIQGGELL
jgi:hypothetical protein